ncbi:MAG: phosphate-starvation-inducible E-like protein [Actinobacteria bacterium]|nr:phosphate-starvation-inducible E-like protein [Actinomycetota bacterium]MBM3713990.1 phosphate-starvation-inducible E-like protein [Actinomycetota bacterium]
MIKILEKFQKIIVIALIIMISIVILLATINLGWEIIKKIITPPIAQISMASLLELFGFFLLILIGIELIETIKVFITKHALRVEIVMLVAIIAASRKIIIIDVGKISDWLLISMGILIVALAAGYYLIKKIHVDKNDKQDN